MSEKPINLKKLLDAIKTQNAELINSALMDLTRARGQLEEFGINYPKDLKSTLRSFLFYKMPDEQKIQDDWQFIESQIHWWAAWTLGPYVVDVGSFDDLLRLMVEPTETDDNRIMAMGGLKLMPVDGVKIDNLMRELIGIILNENLSLELRWNAYITLAQMTGEKYVDPTTGLNTTEDDFYLDMDFINSTLDSIAARNKK